jgi:hypothetical protein
MLADALAVCVLILCNVSVVVHEPADVVVSPTNAGKPLHGTGVSNAA